MQTNTLFSKFEKANKMANAKSSLNMQNADISKCDEHNLRLSKIEYLLEHLYYKKVNEHKKYQDYYTFKSNAMAKYKKKFNQRMQKKQIDSLFKEAIINLNECHTIDDIENVFNEIRKIEVTHTITDKKGKPILDEQGKKITETKSCGGFTLLDVTIHRDEGVFIDSRHNIDSLTYDGINQKWYASKDDITNYVIDYAPNRNIFYDKETEKWYAEKEFENKIDTSKLQLKINYHAHVVFSMFDEQTCKSARLNKKALSQLQTVVANSLKMERGEVNSRTIRKEHYQTKENHDKQRKLKLEFVELVKECEVLEEENQSLKEEKRSLKFNYERYKDEYEAAEEENKELRKENEALKKKILELENSNAYIFENEKNLIDAEKLTFNDIKNNFEKKENNISKELDFEQDNYRKL